MVINDNMLSVSQSFFSPDIVQKISDFIGQSADKTKVGLKSVIPELMTGIVDKGSTPEGAAKLVDMVNTHNYEATSKPDENKINEGNEVVNNIFGSNLNNIVSKLGATTGLNSGSITKMLGLIAPVFMGVLGSKVKNEKLGAPGLMNFLSQQKNVLSSFSAGAAGVTGMASKSPEALQQNFVKESSWTKVALAALIFLGLLFWWMGSHNKVAVPVVTSTTPVQQQNAQTVSIPLSELNAFMMLGAAANLPKHFRFEKLTFATGTTSLAPGAEEELDRIAIAMTQYPQAKARLEGFTDNVGQAEVNKELSAQRALAVKAQLVSRGVDENRIQAVGMGSENPVADNTTEQGRALNRRIEFVVTQVK